MQKYLTTRRKYTIIEGVLVPLISGGDGSGEGDDEDSGESEDDEGDEGEPTTPPPKSRTFTEDRVDAIVKKRVGQAQRRSRQELAKELGFDSVEEMKDALKKKSDDASQESKDLDKEREKAKAAQAEADRIKTEAAQERLNLKVERRLLHAGLIPTKAEKAVVLLGLSVDDEPDDADIKDAVADFKKEWPELFDLDEGEEEDSSTKSRVPGSDVGRQPKKKPRGSAEERALARLHERHPELAKKD